MISFLRGVIATKQPPYLTLEVNGVGYEIQAPMSTFYHLPDLLQSVTLLTHLIVREDAHLLYGFLQPTERDLFRALIKVNGVGPKLALAILSGITTEEYIQCIHQNDVARLTYIPGIGKKTAERLIIETRDAVSNWHKMSENAGIDFEQNYIQDAISALTALGYKPAEAQKAVRQVQNAGRNSEELIRLALQLQL
ncbi:MAG: Holliday junction branch migration protein RuvA [Proteobacteria bacterium]|nr:Holliday junction branch migration protein RuvA [Pseudomonadota bacterium]